MPQWGGFDQAPGTTLTYAVSCPSATACVGAGYDESTSSSGSATYAGTLSEWNLGLAGTGNDWQQASTVPDTTVLYGVSCPNGGSTCWAVGYGANGSTEEGVVVPVSSAGQPGTPTFVAGAAYLYAVSCPSASFCLAVGQNADGQGVSVTIASGGGGSTTPSTTTTVAPSTVSLNAISCPSASLCWAVGTSSSSGNPSVLDQWSSSAGQWASSPDQVDSSDTLYAVSCPSASLCWAVGTDTSQSSGEGVAIEWTGQWGTPTAVAGTGGLYGVSCPSTMLCWAAGYADIDRYEEAATVPWDPAVQAGWGDAQDLPFYYLTGVDCPATNACLAVGQEYTGSGYYGVSAQWLSSPGWGDESLIPPAPSSSSSSSSSDYSYTLNGVSCPDAQSCMAVGVDYSTEGGGSYGASSQWNPAGGWSAAEALPSTSELDAVACPSSSLCVAVGVANSSSSQTGIVETWTSSSSPGWSNPVPVTGTSQLDAISCTSTSSCLALGTSSGGSGGPVSVTVDPSSGSAGTPVPVPLPSGSGLFSLSCPEEGAFCWAVGEVPSGSSTEGAAIQWDVASGAWGTLGTVPGSADLSGVSCPSTSTCLADGDSPSGAALGTQWSTTSDAWSAPVQIPGATNIEPTLSCASDQAAGTVCWGAGNNYNGILDMAELVRWTPDSGWQLATFVPDAYYVNAVSCTSTGGTLCWAVGSPNQGEGAYAAQYQPPSIGFVLPPTPSPATDYDGHPLYQGVFLSRAAAQGTSCPASGYSPVPATSAGTSQAYDDTADPGASYCYQVSYQDHSWLSPPVLVGPVSS
jgi:hypothetical protein